MAAVAGARRRRAAAEAHRGRRRRLHRLSTLGDDDNDPGAMDAPSVVSKYSLVCTAFFQLFVARC